MGGEDGVRVEMRREPVTARGLVSGRAVVGPGGTEAAAGIDENGKTTTVAKAGGMRVYKRQTGDDTKLKIKAIAIEDDNVVMSYNPAGE